VTEHARAPRFTVALSMIAWALKLECQDGADAHLSIGAPFHV
jgi:hypothetical protein